jgi:hypothetical protein
LWGASAIGNGELGVGLYANLIPKALNQEASKRFSTSFDDERLDVVGMQTLKVQWVGMIDDEALGIGSSPFANVQLRFFAFISYSTNEDGIFLSTKLVGEHLGERVRDLHRLEVIIDETISRLGPFQDNIGPFFAMECEETAIQGLAFFLEYTHFDLDASLSKLADASTLNFCEFIDATYHHATYTFLNNQVSTRRRFAIMRTRLERNVDGGVFQMGLVLGTY